MVKNLMALVIALPALLGVTAAAAASAQVGAPASERFILSGLIVFDGGEGLAWLQEPSLTQNNVVTVRPGDSVGPWKLTRILEDRVELEGPAGKVLVPLSNAGGGGTLASASPVPPSRQSTSPEQTASAGSAASTELQSRAEQRINSRGMRSQRIEALMERRRQRESNAQAGVGSAAQAQGETGARSQPPRMQSEPSVPPTGNPFVNAPAGNPFINVPMGDSGRAARRLEAVKQLLGTLSGR
jgi:hypothetical protein